MAIGAYEEELPELETARDDRLAVIQVWYERGK